MFPLFRIFFIGNVNMVLKGKKKFNWIDRFTAFDEIASSLEANVNGELLCITSKNLGDAIEMSHRFGSPSAYGEAWIGYTFKNDHKISVKKMPLSRYDQGVAFTAKQLSSGGSAWSEIATYIFCTLLVMAKICPNLPVLYKYFWCPSCKFVNKAIGSKPKPCLMVVNELADGDLKNYLEKRTSIWNPKLVDNCVFQIAAGLYTMEKYYKLTHNDLHYGNVLVHEIAPGGYWQYKIDGNIYHVPNLGYMFVLWDFGMSHIPGKMKGRSEFKTMDATPIPNETDIGQICANMNDVLKGKKGRPTMGKGQHPLLGQILKLEGRITLKKIISEFFPFYKNVKKLEKPLDSFNMDIPKSHLRNAHPKELVKFL